MARRTGRALSARAVRPSSTAASSVTTARVAANSTASTAAAANATRVTKAPARPLSVTRGPDRRKLRRDVELAPQRAISPTIVSIDPESALRQSQCWSAPRRRQSSINPSDRLNAGLAEPMPSGLAISRRRLDGTPEHRAAMTFRDSHSGEGQWAFAIDRGGTFTDVIGRAPDDRVLTLKLPSAS